jgi:hypothetical protein
LRITDDEAAVIKGMLERGDKQQWIAAWFGGEVNSGRVAEINTGAKFADVKPAPPDKLPPVGPYTSGRSAHRALIALGPVKAAIDRAIEALTRMDAED